MDYIERHIRFTPLQMQEMQKYMEEQSKPIQFQALCEQLFLDAGIIKTTRRYEARLADKRYKKRNSTPNPATDSRFTRNNTEA